MMIPRNKESVARKILRSFPVLGIIGPRQVGKTTLAGMLMKNIPRKESVYIDLENPEDASRLNDPVLFFKMNERKCVVLDEIQRKPELFTVLRSMIDLRREPARFILLGSSSPHLIRESSESLAGRIAYEVLCPLNLTEITGRKDMFHHWFSGGFPDAFLTPDDSVRSLWLSNFIKTYIERDLPMLGLEVNRDTIRKLWLMIAHIQGNVLNISNLSRSLGLTSPTVKKYISFMEDAFLIRQLPPFTPNVKKRLVKSPKIYIRDSGILHQLLGIFSFDELQGHPVLGNSWEGYVTEQIYQLSEKKFDLYFYRTHDGAECDLVLAKGNKPVASIEIKYTSAPKTSKGLLQAFGDLHTKKNFIVTPRTDDYPLTEHIRVCNLETFLTKYLPEFF